MKYIICYKQSSIIDSVINLFMVCNRSVLLLSYENQNQAPMQISEAESSSIIVIVPEVFLLSEPLYKAGSSILIHVGFDTPEGPYVVYPG